MRYSEVDVFTDRLLDGNPVAVVHDADGLDDETMAAFARWTNLSETTFLLSPTRPEADYRVRIFTPGEELPFAGHPTLGSARAWLEAGGVPARAGAVVQECGAGLVTVRLLSDDGASGRSSATRLAFAAPPLLRSGPADDATLATAAAGLGIEVSAVRAASWIDNGPGWLGVLLASADEVLALRPDARAMGDLRLGVAGPHDPSAGTRPADLEVRAFVPGIGIDEDPVTGSLAAGLGMWLPSTGVVGESFTIRQGTVLRRRGLVSVSRDDDGTVWVAGDTVVGVTGEAALR